MFTGRLLTILKQANLPAVHKTIQINNYLRSSLNVQNIRLLYAKSALGLNGFEQTCQTTQKQMENIVDNFKQRMADYIEEGSKNMVFTEDLKNMIHVSTDQKDIELVVKMIKKFNQQNKELRFGNFIFGPVVMRLFHYQNQPDLALECFKSTDLDGFFDQQISYQILLDLLYENHKYDEMLECVDLIRQKQLEGMRYPKNIVVLAMAACYKMNSKESLEYALKLWQQLKDIGHFPMRRATTFCAALAYNQGNPGVALEILSSSKNQNYTTVRNLKVASLAALGRVEDAMPIIKGVLSEDIPGNHMHTFNKLILDKVGEAVKALDNAEISLEFNRLGELLQKQGQITEVSIDEQLCQEIKPPALNREYNQGPKYEQTYTRPQSTRRIFTRRKFQQRPGLDELV